MKNFICKEKNFKMEVEFQDDQYTNKVINKY